MTFQDLCVGIVYLQRSQIGIVLPQFRTARADIREELVGITVMEVSHRGGQRHHVTGRLKVN
jgi:hypothetical protein